MLGIRPDAMEDAAVRADAPDDRRFSAVVELRETVGSEAFIHFTLDAAPVITEDTRDLASDAGAEALERLEEEASRRQTTVIARFHGTSPAREGERVEIFVDTRALHFFDPETGEGIYD